MTKADKAYARIVNNPKDVDFAELDRLLKRHGFERRQPGGGSSHYNYHHPGLPDILTVPYGRPVKAISSKRPLLRFKD